MTRSPLGGQIEIAGKQVSRLGLSTMRLTGACAWGEPNDYGAAVAVLRAAADTHGVTYIDTADAYGPHFAEQLVREALFPYRDEVLVATKVGVVRPTADHWAPLGRPEYLRHAVEGSLRRLDVERLDLCYLHWLDPEVAVADQIGTLMEMRAEGKIGHVGVVNATEADLTLAMMHGTIAAVQNRLNLSKEFDPVLDMCATAGIPYVASRPLNSGKLAADPLKALSWVLARGRHVAAIPATSSLSHLEELVGAAAGMGADGSTCHMAPPTTPCGP
ncbi:aldo/keto reductase [Streptomyces sp. NPDC093568]|uniref:aldo/keto reductase n=1 Tax=Streptomyces sp. NPDC093568 TaxID=3366041 RepID=UPI003824F420